MKMNKTMIIVFGIVLMAGLASAITIDDFNSGTISSQWTIFGPDANFVQESGYIHGATSGIDIRTYRGFYQDVGDPRGKTFEFRFSNTEPDNYVDCGLTNDTEMMFNPDVYYYEETYLQINNPAGLNPVSMNSSGAYDYSYTFPVTVTTEWYTVRMSISDEGYNLIEVWAENGTYLGNYTPAAAVGNANYFACADHTASSGEMKVDYIKMSPPYDVIVPPIVTTSQAGAIAVAVAGSAGGRAANTQGFGAPQIIGLGIIAGIVAYSTGMIGNVSKIRLRKKP